MIIKGKQYGMEELTATLRFPIGTSNFKYEYKIEDYEEGQSLLRNLATDLLNIKTALGIIPEGDICKVVYRGTTGIGYKLTIFGKVVGCAVFNCNQQDAGEYAQILECYVNQIKQLD